MFYNIKLKFISFGDFKLLNINRLRRSLPKNSYVSVILVCLIVFLCRIR
jgi:hypothetical protein